MRPDQKRKNPSNKELTKQAALFQVQSIYQTHLIRFMTEWVHANAPQVKVDDFNNKVLEFSQHLLKKQEEDEGKQIIAPETELIVPG
ncbi:MAG: hypothetical protein KAS32_23830 [Candidatus Peribacteraceae bacterium]|nr:hypothetical protein [Candidatus Peribacteraceae bacterium]